MLRKLIIIGAPLLVLLAGFGIFVALHATKPEPEKTVEEARPVALFVETVRKEPVNLTVLTQGEVRPRTEIDLVPQVAGRITSVYHSFVEGGIAKAGETLIQIDDADYRLDLTRAEARVAEARLKLQREEADAEIVRKQWQEWLKEKPGALALKRPHLAEAQAKLRAAEADLEDARLDVERTRITVPFDGRIRQKMVDVGQYVSPGTPLARVFSTEVVEIRLPLTDEQLSRLNLPIAFSSPNGEGPKVLLTANVGGRIAQWRGRITRTSAAIDPETRLLYAIAEVPNPYALTPEQTTPLAVGLFVNAEIEGRTVDNALIVPRAALRSGDTVYVVDGENRLNIRKVSIIASNDHRAILRSGVAEGERVVVSPVQAAQDGMEVEPLTRETALNIAAVSD